MLLDQKPDQKCAESTQACRIAQCKNAANQQPSVRCTLYLSLTAGAFRRCQSHSSLGCKREWCVLCHYVLMSWWVSVTSSTTTCFLRPAVGYFSQTAWWSEQMIKYGFKELICFHLRLWNPWEIPKVKNMSFKHPNILFDVAQTVISLSDDFFSLSVSVNPKNAPWMQVRWLLDRTNFWLNDTKPRTF